MIKIRKPYDDVELRPHVVGSPVEPVYRLTRDENGNAIYTMIGEKNVPKDIESYRSGCSLASQLERMQFMPAREKIQYLQQTEAGVSADLSTMPKDGTEAYMLYNEVLRSYPGLFQRVKNGESFDAVLKDMFIKKTEVSDNGSNESSDAGSAAV